MVGDFGSFPQRYIISNAEIGKLENAPNEIWAIPAGDGVGQQTSVGQFQPVTWATICKLDQPTGG